MEISGLNFNDFSYCFVTIFIVIDIIGSIPILLEYKNKNGFHENKTTLFTLIAMLFFLFFGEFTLKVLGIDIESFAIAGSVILFILSMEMLFGIRIHVDIDTKKTSVIIPIVFPILSGPGTISTILSLRTEYDMLPVFLAIVLNALFILLILKIITPIGRILGVGTVNLIKKFFGIVLMAISIKIFLTNITKLLANISSN